MSNLWLPYFPCGILLSKSHSILSNGRCHHVGYAYVARQYNKKLILSSQLICQMQDIQVFPASHLGECQVVSLNYSLEALADPWVPCSPFLPRSMLLTGK